MKECRMKKLNIEQVCQRAEAVHPAVHAESFPAIPQIIVTFSNRPDVIMALLTPYAQQAMRKGRFKASLLGDLLLSVKRIAGHG